MTKTPTKQEIKSAIEKVLQSNHDSKENASILYESIFSPLRASRAYYRAMTLVLTVCIICLLAVYPSAQNKPPHHFLEQATLFAEKSFLDVVPVIKTDIKEAVAATAGERRPTNNLAAPSTNLNSFRERTTKSETCIIK